MSYYATHNGVSTGAGTLEITEAQYLDAIEKISKADEAGRAQRIAIIDGALTFYAGPVYLIDADGLLAGKADELPEGAPLITDAPDSSLVKPKRVDGAWVEGATAEELAAHAAEEIEQTQVLLLAAVDAHLNEAAQGLNYDSIVTAVTYATSTHPKFGPEGRAFLAWRDAVYQTCYTLLDEVQAGTRAVPTKAELIALLPALNIVYQS